VDNRLREGTLGKKLLKEHNFCTRQVLPSKLREEILGAFFCNRNPFGNFGGHFLSEKSFPQFWGHFVCKENP
jgi:hypothetical protein